MATNTVEIRLPDFDLPHVPTIASVWHFGEGREVFAGDCLLEILAGEVSIDVCTPITGILRQKMVAEDATVLTGQLLGIVESMC